MHHSLNIMIVKSGEINILLASHHLYCHQVNLLIWFSIRRLSYCTVPCTLGEYVAVESLEGKYKLASVVNQVWVYGNSFETKLVAVVVPAEGALMSWASENGISGSFEVSVCCWYYFKILLILFWNTIWKHCWYYFKMLFESTVDVV